MRYVLFPQLAFSQKPRLYQSTVLIESYFFYLTSLSGDCIIQTRQFIASCVWINSIIISPPTPLICQSRLTLPSVLLLFERQTCFPNSLLSDCFSQKVCHASVLTKGLISTKRDKQCSTFSASKQKKSRVVNKIFQATKYGGHLIKKYLQYSTYAKFWTKIALLVHLSIIE